jgi:3-oxoacyl-ACP reductase-like protein
MTAATPVDPAATAASAAMTASAAMVICDLHAAANVFLIEDMKRRETDVGHFLFAKNEAVIGRGIVRLRDIGSGYGGCGCTPD